MKPIDYRTATWEGIQSHLTNDRFATLQALRQFGPCTTRQLAEAMDWDILCVRPRVTELYQLGFCELLSKELRDPAPGREGIYQALTDEQAHSRFRQQQFDHACPQLNLTF